MGRLKGDEFETGRLGNGPTLTRADFEVGRVVQIPFYLPSILYITGKSRGERKKCDDRSDNVVSDVVTDVVTTDVVTDVTNDVTNIVISIIEKMFRVHFDTNVCIRDIRLELFKHKTLKLLYCMVNHRVLMNHRMIYQHPSKHDHMGPMWAIGGQIAIWVL